MRCLILLCFCMASTALFADPPHYNCAFVSAKEGINVRSAPEITAQVLMKLQYGDRLRIIYDPGDQDEYEPAPAMRESLPEQTLRLGKKTYKGHWLKVVAGPLSNMYPYPYLDRESTTIGYVFSAFVSTYLEEIPARSLYYYYTLSLGGGLTDVSYAEQPDKPVYYDGCAITYDGIVLRKKYSCNCYEYYKPNTSDPQFYFNGIGQITGGNSSVLDTLKHYLELELLGNRLPKKIYNPYTVDTTPVHRIVSGATFIYGDSAYGDTQPLAQFYLSISGGKDSVLISDDWGEFHISRNFVGQIRPLNKYLVNHIFEGPSHRLIDKSTGEETNFTEGMPYISPDKKYVIDFFHQYSYSPDDGCVLTLGVIDDSLAVKRIISVHFKSWLPVEEVNSAFWVSDRELVIKAYPVGNLYYMQEKGANYPYTYDHYQYIKLRIKD